MSGPIRGGSEHIWLNDCSAGGIYLYQVMRGRHEVYDEFLSTGPLTWSQQADVAEGYREALEGIE